MIGRFTHLRKFEVVKHIVPIDIKHPEVIGLLEVFQYHLVMVSILLLHGLQRHLRSNIFVNTFCRQLLD